MWAITVVLLQALVGPEVHVITQAGIYTSEDGCKAAIAASIPAKLEGEPLAQFKNGYRRYVCVRVNGAEDLRTAK
ncbi:hypothetical protein [Aquabacter cavernae]|uniref:hypothetical protein n=1 Tax=Aquabacter cavernae TaxID=2496029 RepID=UPI000F8D1726|nr:hypothetical protein [Aquabacter cavernae]